MHKCYGMAAAVTRTTKRHRNGDRPMCFVLGLVGRLVEEEAASRRHIYVYGADCNYSSGRQKIDTEKQTLAPPRQVELRTPCEEEP